MGEMFRNLAAATLLCMVSTQAAMAADPVLDVFGGFSVQPYSTYGYAGGVSPMNGNLNVDGFLTRLSVGIGSFSYQTTPGARQGVGQQQADAMVGYQLYLDAARLSVYGGVELQNYDNTDVAAAIRGAQIGAKGQVELYSPIGPKFFGFALGTLSSNYTSYYTKAKIGYRITEAISFGPEGSAQGNSQYDQVSTGGAFGFRVGRTEFYLSGGYVWDLRSQGGGGPSGPGSSGLYGQAGLGLRF
jgi:hypothetical protein